MADEVTPFPFATVDELKARWPDFPVGAETHAEALLEDASQFILDVCPAAAGASASTRRRVVCAVVKRAMPSGVAAGVNSVQQSAGPFAVTYTPTNPSGDFYLTKQEKLALGCGMQQAFGVQVAGFRDTCHLPWCNLNFGATYCSCGADIAGHPIYERG